MKINKQTIYIYTYINITVSATFIIMKGDVIYSRTYN